GSEGDYSCAQVIDRATGLQCAELRGHFPPQELARRAAALAAEYNHALLIIERNNHGHGVLAHLQNMLNQSSVIPNGSCSRLPDARRAEALSEVEGREEPAVAARMEQAFRPAFEAAKKDWASAPEVEGQDFSPAARRTINKGASAPTSLYEKNSQLGWLTTAA